jgi:hypothetical protein
MYNIIWPVMHGLGMRQPSHGCNVRAKRLAFLSRLQSDSHAAGPQSAPRLQSALHMMTQRMQCRLHLASIQLLGGDEKTWPRGLSPPASPNAEPPRSPPRPPRAQRSSELANPQPPDQGTHEQPLNQDYRSGNKHDKNRCLVPLLLATIQCTDFSCLPASCHRGFNSLRYVLSFYRFIGDTKSISAGHERIIVNRTPTRLIANEISPCLAVYKGGSYPHSHFALCDDPVSLSGNRCGSVFVFSRCLPPCRLGLRPEGQRLAKIHHKKR